MLQGELIPLVGEDRDGKRLRFFGRVVLRCPGRRDLTRWFGDGCKTPMEALLDALEWAASYVPRERKTPRPQQCGPLGKAV